MSIGMRVAFQGIPGAYSEVAARKFFGRQCATVPFDSFDDVFDAVEQKRADRGIVPIENSLAGSIHQNYDLLLSHSLHIIGELHFRIEHVLMAHPASSLASLTQVRSHPQGLAQCSEFIRAQKHVKPYPYFDTAGAAKSVRDEKNPSIAAIASARAAKLYGLKILRRNIENKSHNFTRFLVLGRSGWRAQRHEKAKTSILFAPANNYTGILFQILGVFYVRNIDLLKIESRPDPHAPFEYLFYVDLQGSPKEKRVAEALEHLQEKTKFFRLLGVYPMGRRKFYGAA